MKRLISSNAFLILCKLVVITEKKRKTRELKGSEKLTWATIPSEDCILISEENSVPNELRSLSSVTESVAMLPSMEDYGTQAFRSQFSEIAEFLPPIDGMKSLYQLQPLMQIPAEFGHLGSIDSKVMTLLDWQHAVNNLQKMFELRLDSEQNWIQHIYSPLLNLDISELSKTFTFQLSDYNKLFKGKWQEIHTKICKSLGIRIKHPCCDILSIYNPRKY